jgi:hypothetical protein
VNKFPRVALKPLKLTISDFYGPEDITAAKDCLVHEIDALKIEKWTKPPRRRKDSVTRLTGEIDDIVTMIAMLDEIKSLGRLPLFVSTDPDKMPSVKLTDGDLAAVLLKLEKLDEESSPFNNLSSRPPK